MSGLVTYQQQDTLQLKGLLELHQKNVQPIKLKVERIPISERNLRPIDSIEKKREPIVEEPAKPTMAQIRYWLRKQEESLLVGSSRTMKPITKAAVYTTETSKAAAIQLPVKRISYTSVDWLTIILLGALLVFASMKKQYHKYLVHLFQSLINYSTASRMFREREISLLHGSYRLEAYFYITFSIFAYFTVEHFNTSTPFQGVPLYLFSLGCTLGYFLFKRLLYMMMGVIIEGVPTTKEYLYNQNNFNRVLGLALFPIIACVLFSPILSTRFFIVLGLVLIGIFYFLILQRGILILIKKQFSIYYLFLYLCTLEILPLLLIYKLVWG